jgi:hypothetical protein
MRLLAVFSHVIVQLFRRGVVVYPKVLGYLQGNVRYYQLAQGQFRAETCRVAQKLVQRVFELRVDVAVLCLSGLYGKRDACHPLLHVYALDHLDKAVVQRRPFSQDL